MTALTDIQIKYWHHQTPDADAVAKALEEAYALGAADMRTRAARMMNRAFGDPVAEQAISQLRLKGCAACVTPAMCALQNNCQIVSA